MARRVRAMDAIELSEARQVAIDFRLHDLGQVLCLKVLMDLATHVRSLKSQEHVSCDENTPDRGLSSFSWT